MPPGLVCNVTVIFYFVNIFENLHTGNNALLLC